MVCVWGDNAKRRASLEFWLEGRGKEVEVKTNMKISMAR